MNLDPIVSLCGPPDLHERADRYNHRRNEYRDTEDDLEDAHRWNLRERFAVGFFDQTRPPVPTHHLTQRLNELRAELSAERAEIAALVDGTVKP